jgi:hypothetical protein
VRVRHRWFAAIIPVKKGDFLLDVQLAVRDGLKAAYYDNAYLIGQPIITRIDSVVNFTWGLGRISQYGTDFVSVRWLGKVLSEFDGVYSFSVIADDNVRLWVNDQLLIDKWWSFAGDSYGNITLTSGRLNDIRIEYRCVLSSSCY